MTVLPTRKDEAYRYSDLDALARVWPVAAERIVVAAGETLSHEIVNVADAEDVAQALNQIYSLTPEEREERGKSAYEWVTSDESRMSARKMCQNMIESIDDTLDTFTPKFSYELIKIEDRKPKHINHSLTY